MAGGLTAAVAGAVVSPGAWASSVLTAKYGGSGMGTVGPSGSGSTVSQHPQRRVDSSMSANSSGR
ncbi:hypothetical protein, partial [Saccharothrix sp. ST-888]|uniref:hypothetical protein n=1 Tax=Saccharothrix sp. ST-888 TaxID=1427391 RepID=UPI0005ECC8EE